MLFEGGIRFQGTGSIAPYDVTADGQRFVMVQSATEVDAQSIVENWFEELRQRVPVN